MMTPDHDNPKADPHTDPVNEIVETARAAKGQADRTADKPEPGRNRGWNAAAITVGVGIGSAAVAAALLYANRGKPKK